MRHIAGIMIFCAALLVLAPAVSADDASDWYVKAQGAVSAGNYATAIQYYDNAIAMDPNYATAYAGKAIAQNQLGQFSDALVSADKALAIKTNADALNARAYALFSLGRYDEAVLTYDALYQVQSNYPYAYCNQGKAYIQLNETEKALTAFDRCVFYMPDNFDGWNEKGLALISLGRYDEALDAYDHATKITIKNATIWNNKGLAYAGLENYNKALICFKTALSIDPAYEDAKANMEKTYERKPFVTPSDTQTVILTTLPAEQTPSITYEVTQKQTAAPSQPTPTKVLTPQDNPPAIKTTYAPVSLVAVIVALIAGILLAHAFRYKK
jgi:tetratricopeptide (TPR) repeat protein